MTRRETQEKNFLTEVRSLKAVGGEQALHELLPILRRLGAAFDAVGNDDASPTPRDLAIVTAGLEGRHMDARRLILADIAQEASPP